MGLFKGIVSIGQATTGVLNLAITAASVVSILPQRGTVIAPTIQAVCTVSFAPQLVSSDGISLNIVGASVVTINPQRGAVIAPAVQAVSTVSFAPQLISADGITLNIVGASVVTINPHHGAVISPTITGVSVAQFTPARGQTIAPAITAVATVTFAPDLIDGAPELARTSNGLVLQEPFSSTTGWTAGDNWAVDATIPAMVMSERSPIPALTPTPASPDAGGVREGCPFIDDDGTWYMYYGAGDGTGGPGGPWRPQCVSSTDQGITWTQHGSMGIDLRKNNGFTEFWGARDLLVVYKIAGTYYLEAMIADGQISNVPAAPYRSDLWTSSTPIGPWTWVSMQIDIGPNGDFDDGYALTGCILLSGGTYYNFYSGNDGSDYRVGLATSTALIGPWTKNGTPVLPDAIRGQPENPRVFFNPVINKWVMMCNHVNLGLGITDANMVFISDSLTDWSACRRIWTQRVSPASGARAVGMGSPFYIAGQLEPLVTEGIAPTAYDTDPTGEVFDHINRKLRYAQLEPAASALTCRPAVGGGASFSDNFNRANAALADGVLWDNFLDGGVNIVSNKADLGSTVGPKACLAVGFSAADVDVSAKFTIGTNAGISLVLRAQNASNFYHVGITTSGFSSLGVYKVVGGVETNIRLIDQAFPENTETPFRVTLVGNTFTIYLNGVQVDTFNDSSITAAGRVGLRNGYGATTQRLAEDFSAIDLGGGGGGPVESTYERAYTSANLNASFWIEPRSLPAASFNGIDYRIQANGDRYRFRIGPTGSYILQRIIGGVATAITPNASPTLALKVNHASAVRVLVVGTNHKIYLDGELQVDATDATLSTSTKLGFSTLGGDANIRRLHVRTGNDVTITGLTAGNVVRLRAYGDYPVASGTAAGASLALTSVTYPLHSIEVNGVTYPITGGIWGGDTYNYTP